MTTDKRGIAMNVSKVSFSRETRALLDNPVLDRRKRLRLRRDRVTEYIKEQPAGKPIQIGEIIAVAGYDIRNRATYNLGYQFIRGLIKKDVIRCDKLKGKRTAAWSVPGMVRHIPPKDTKDTSPSDDQKLQDFTTKTSNINDIESRARQFAWYSNSDSLREFIRWLPGDNEVMR